MPDPRVAIVTGASSGIGEAIAGRLSDAGFRVFCASRSTSTVPGVAHLTVDVTDDASVRDGVAAVLDETGRVDLLVNNAGFLVPGAVEEQTLEDAQAMFATNYFGVLRMTLAVLPGMRARGGGHIITNSSLAGLVPVPFWGQYNASKGAVEGLMETLRHEVRPFGIKVAMIEAGAIRTRLYGHPPAAGLPAYAGARGRALAVMDSFVAKGPGPDLVARKVLSLAQSTHPRLRNTITREAKQFTLLKWLLPQGLFEAGVRSGFKLSAKGNEARPLAVEGT